MAYVIWIVFSIFLVFLALGYSELRSIAANIKEISKPSYNSVRDASCSCQPPFYINNVTFSSLYKFCPWCGRNLHP